ncbi:predicted protein [Nematostella vectensis]|uniref:Sulfatase N-terminal domain-containing protein n=1 Tax=Nematostella vectensis TaxID=45351 RepID=A7SQ82_NEMVE|nr:steryl-sulfatase [Nematostella vectensis]EDO34137.1 predicted protein [Nematostella vectensis]|eukprot:XP_001626237.1 predicted protein [Nematostella vectensis]
MQGYLFLLLLSFGFSSIQCKPNFVIFLVDDLGIGDIGCFGNDTINTPNIDKLASEGARLAHNLAPESVCTPSRAAFLTGRYAIRSGLASEPGLIGRMFLFSASAGGLPQNETTFAAAVRGVGYKTGMVGKWHLGLNKDKADDFHHHPLKHGFDSFYGLPVSNLRPCLLGETIVDYLDPNWRTMYNLKYLGVVVVCLIAFAMGKTLRLIGIVVITIATAVVVKEYAAILREHMLTCILMKDYKIVEQPYDLNNLTMRFTDEAVGFIEKNREQPFLLFMSFAKVHTPMFTSDAFKGRSKHGSYGDNVEEMDWSVGEIVGALERLGLRNNTLVYLTSDQGPHLEEGLESGWKGIYKGGKGQAYEGGIRVPTVASWPSRIPAGIDINEPTCSFDIFPTVLNLAGARLPGDRIIDGKDMMPLLTQKEETSPHEFLFHYCAKSIHATRYRPREGKTTWKAFFFTPKWRPPGSEMCLGDGVCRCYGEDVNVHDPPLLYDITADPSEKNPIPSGDARYKKVMPNIIAATRVHEGNVDEVPNQLNKNWHVFFLPTQSCCNYPLCYCKEHQSPPKHYPGEL